MLTRFLSFIEDGNTVIVLSWNNLIIDIYFFLAFKKLYISNFGSIVTNGLLLMYGLTMKVPMCDVIPCQSIEVRVNTAYPQ